MFIDEKKLALFMAEHELTVRQVISRSKISSATFYKAVLRKKSVTPKTVGKLAKALNVGVEYLIKDGE